MDISRLPWVAPWGNRDDHFGFVRLSRRGESSLPPGNRYRENGCYLQRFPIEKWGDHNGVASLRRVFDRPSQAGGWPSVVHVPKVKSGNADYLLCQLILVYGVNHSSRYNGHGRISAKPRRQKAGILGVDHSGPKPDNGGFPPQVRYSPGSGMSASTLEITFPVGVVVTGRTRTGFNSLNLPATGLWAISNETG